VAGILFVIGLGLILYWVFMRKRSAVTPQWPTVQGQIIESRLIETLDTEGSSWEMRVAYTYQVAGAAYQSRRVSIGPVNLDKTVKRYPVGALVNVFYDPQKPGSAVLEHVKPRTMRIVLAVGSACAAVGLLLVIGGAAGHSAGTTDGYSRAVELYNKGSYTEARVMFAALAQKGSAESKAGLGVLYAKGQGVPQDFVEAQKWFILAGDAGKSNREQVAKGLRPEQEAEAEKRAASWTASR